MARRRIDFGITNLLNFLSEASGFNPTRVYARTDRWSTGSAQARGRLLKERPEVGSRQFRFLFRKEMSGVNGMPFNICAPLLPEGEGSGFVGIPGSKGSTSAPQG